MTTARSPLVRLSTGKIAELPAGDSILGAPGGPAATVTVGTTTTGAPGSSASVTNVGSSSAAVLDFTIPQGVPGTNGTNGANGTGSGANFICNGRLTLTSGVPVTASDVTGATTIYFTPYMGGQISTYDAGVWTGHTLSEISLALGTLTSGKNYDVFVYSNSGTLTLELSAAWTNDTTRANALAVQDGVQVKSADHSRRYLGTFRTTSTTTTEDSALNRLVWNVSNQVRRSLQRSESATSWTYNTATWRQAHANAANQAAWVDGLGYGVVDARLLSICTNTGAARVAAGLGLDVTTAPSQLAGAAIVGNSGWETQMTAHYSGVPGMGFHSLKWLEWSQAVGTTTWYGSGTFNSVQNTTGIAGSTFA